MIDAAALVGVEFVVVAIVCGFLIKYYQSPLVTPDVSVTVYISWVLGFAAVLILPYDVSVAVVDEYRSKVLVQAWAFVYWSTFFLAWCVLPIQMEYHNSGQFTFKGKLFDAFRTLFLAAAAAVVIALIYIIYMVSTRGTSISDILAFAMAMSNTYGVLLITFFMGSGLAGLPKRLWAMSNIEGELTRLYLSAPHIEDDYQESRYNLEDVEVEIKKAIDANLKNGSSNEVEIEALKQEVANFNFANKSTTRAFVKSDSAKTKDYTDKAELVGLHAKLIKGQIKARANERRWRVLISQCKQYRDSQTNDPNQIDTNWCLMPVGDGNSPAGLSLFTQCYVSAYKFWITKCYKPTLRISAVICTFFSIVILWCELLMASKLESPIGYFMNAYNPSQTSPILVQAVSFITLSYMSVCTYWTLFRLNIGWSYRLDGPQLSPPSSLIFNAEYLSRIQFALGYNFLLCLNVNSIQYTAFSSLMNNIEIIPVFGTSFTVYVPILMIIVALITLFDLFARILQLVGVESEESSVRPFSLFFNSNNSSDEMDAELLEKYNSGKAIIDAEIRQLTNQHEQLKKNRERNSVTSVNSSHSQDDQPFKILAPSKDQIKTMVSTHSFGSGSRHSRDDRDEDLDEVDLEFNNIHGNKKNSYTALKNKQDDSKYGGGGHSSIFASSLSANQRDSDTYGGTTGTSVKNPLRSEASNTASHNNRPSTTTSATTTNSSASAASSSSMFSSFGSKPKPPPATLLSTFNNNNAHNNSSNAKASSTNYSKLTSKPAEEPPAKKTTKSTNIFSFDDDDDGTQNAGGRYSNF